MEYRKVILHYKDIERISDSLRFSIDVLSDSLINNKLSELYDFYTHKEIEELTKLARKVESYA